MPLQFWWGWGQRSPFFCRELYTDTRIGSASWTEAARRLWREQPWLVTFQLLAAFHLPGGPPATFLFIQHKWLPFLPTFLSGVLWSACLPVGLPLCFQLHVLQIDQRQQFVRPWQVLNSPLTPVCLRLKTKQQENLPPKSSCSLQHGFSPGCSCCFWEKIAFFFILFRAECAFTAAPDWLWYGLSGSALLPCQPVWAMVKLFEGGWRRGGSGFVPSRDEL